MRQVDEASPQSTNIAQLISYPVSDNRAPGIFVWGVETSRCRIGIFLVFLLPMRLNQP